LTIKFLHLTPQQIDQLCREEKIVEVQLSVYDVKEYTDSYGTRIKEEQKLSSYKVKIRSFNDLIQYDNKDALFLTEEQKDKLS
jgi:serine/threonine-protein kinase RIO1